jgi:hypothetical protein
VVETRDSTARFSDFAFLFWATKENEVMLPRGPLLQVNSKFNVFDPLTGLCADPCSFNLHCSLSDQPQHYSCDCTDVDHYLFRPNLPWVRRCGMDQRYVA